MRPADVAPHRRTHPLIPGRWLRVLAERPPQGALECGRGVLLEEKTRDAVGDGFGQAANPPRGGERSIALGPKLGESAGLEQRWHEQDIRTREEPMFRRIVEVDVDRGARRHDRRDLAKRPLVLPFALAQEDELASPWQAGYR